MENYSFVKITNGRISATNASINKIIFVFLKDKLKDKIFRFCCFLDKNKKLLKINF